MKWGWFASSQSITGQLSDSFSPTSTVMTTAHAPQRVTARGYCVLLLW
jgi:hypothetical protein